MKKNVLLVMWLALAALFTISTMSACSDDDNDSQESRVIGEWISEYGNYFRFIDGGTGTFICLADNPDYDPANPQATIDNAKESAYSCNYTIEGNVLTMASYHSQMKATYVCEIVFVDKNTFKMLPVKYRHDDGEWIMEEDAGWETYKRWK